MGSGARPVAAPTGSGGTGRPQLYRLAEPEVVALAPQALALHARLFTDWIGAALPVAPSEIM